MSKLENVGSLIGMSLWASGFLLYVVGIFATVGDDHRYTGRHVVASIFLPPYTWYVGAVTAYRYATVPSDLRDEVQNCLDIAQANGIARKIRLHMCECTVGGKSVEQCADRYRSP